MAYGSGLPGAAGFGCGGCCANSAVAGSHVTMAAKSAKGADARRQGKKELDCPFGGALDTVHVLRELVKTA